MGSFIRMLVVTMIVAIIQVKTTMVGIRVPPGMGLTEVMRGECTCMSGE